MELNKKSLNILVAFRRKYFLCSLYIALSPLHIHPSVQSEKGKPYENNYTHKGKNKNA